MWYSYKTRGADTGYDENLIKVIHTYVSIVAFLDDSKIAYMVSWAMIMVSKLRNNT